ncbi:MAG: hypothetical protein FIA92_11365 [Chloroflexi bacterium]|nr:hypothetical protein [Chloroflexota bacterium]
MTDEEWRDWNLPILGRPPTGYPCYDCPVAFAIAQRVHGACDGIPRNGLPREGRRRRLYTDDEAVARRRQQWREYNARRKARKEQAA